MTAVKIQCLMAILLVMSKLYLHTTLWFQFYFIRIHVKHVSMPLHFTFSSLIVWKGKEIKIWRARDHLVGVLKLEARVYPKRFWVA